MNPDILFGIVFGIIATLVSGATAWAIRHAGPDTPRPIIPDHLPRFAIYARADDDPVTNCTCHQASLTDGERILIWPTEEILCQLTYGPEAQL